MSIKDLIEQSSLGTPGARALRARAKGENMEFTHEMAGPNLKYKYRVRKPTSGYGSKQNNSGSKPRGTPPKGMPRRYRGKTTFK